LNTAAKGVKYDSTNAFFLKSRDRILLYCRKPAETVG